MTVTLTLSQTAHVGKVPSLVPNTGLFPTPACHTTAVLRTPCTTGGPDRAAPPRYCTILGCHSTAEGKETAEQRALTVQLKWLPSESQSHL